MYRVELERGVWLADGEGDPPRTLIKENAARFATMLQAAKALTKAREYRLFPMGCIVGGHEALCKNCKVVDGEEA